MLIEKLMTKLKLRHLLLVFIFVSSTAHANEEATTTSQNDIIETATFSNNLQLPTPPSMGQVSVGIFNQDAGGWGLIFGKALTNERDLWIFGSYRPKSYLMTEDFSPTPQVAAVDLNESNRLQLLVGIDQMFHLTKNKRWGFIGGLGVGLGRSVYEAKYYRQLCTFYCGFDPSNPKIQKDVDLYAQIIGRIGVGLRDRDVWGVKGRLNFLLGPTLARTPKEFRFIGPGEKEILPIRSTQYFIEAIIEL